MTNRLLTASGLLLPLLLTAIARTAAADDAAPPPGGAQATPAATDAAPPETADAAAPKLEFPLLEELQIPPAEHFLRGDATTQRDWVVLNTGRVVQCVPVTPRPRTIEIRRQEYQAKSDSLRGLPSDKKAQVQKEMAALQAIDVTIPELEPEPEYRILLDRITRIIHHEDQWLQRIDAVINDQNIDLALELLGHWSSIGPTGRALPSGPTI